MPKQVVLTAQMACTMGTTPSRLIPDPKPETTEFRTMANIMDHKSLVNIPPFGMCTTVANPVVASATSAALGVLTPMPCIPATTSPWINGSPDVKLSFFPALRDDSYCMCTYGGKISITIPAQTSETVD